MDQLQIWGMTTSVALQQLWFGFINFIPAFLAAIIIFLVGLIVANGLAELVERLLDLLKIDKALEKIGFKKFTDQANIRLDSGYFVGALVKWLLILAFLRISADILSLSAISDFLMQIITFIPSLIISVVIVLLSVILAEFLAKLVRSSVSGAGLKSSKFLASLTQWSIIIFGLLVALMQIGIGTAILQIFLTGFVAMLALAGGLAFGLGGKEVAAGILSKLKEKVED
ncbi:MAG: hypothetical protein NTW73_01610 [Candidatus Parcubacteria bacterium]|nr:hypothetical protein [Candidatus Parcubacteria bacterium]